MTAKKTVTKKVTKRAPGTKVPMRTVGENVLLVARGESRPAQKWAIVVEVTHKGIIFSHKHYLVEVVEGNNPRQYEVAMLQAATAANAHFKNFKVRVLCVEKVDQIHSL